MNEHMSFTSGLPASPWQRWRSDNIANFTHSWMPRSAYILTNNYKRMEFHAHPLFGGVRGGEGGIGITLTNRTLKKKTRLWCWHCSLSVLFLDEQRRTIAETAILVSFQHQIAILNTFWLFIWLTGKKKSNYCITLALEFSGINVGTKIISFLHWTH